METGSLMPSPSENAETANFRSFAVSNMQMSSGFPDSMGFNEHVLQTFGCSPVPIFATFPPSFLFKPAFVAFVFLAQTV